MYTKKMLADYLADNIVYRKLIPADASLPGLEDIWQQVGLSECRVPRKTEDSYAAIVMRLLEEAQAQRGQSPLRDLLFIGDTLVNDGTAARNLAGLLPLCGFIGADRLNEESRAKLDGPLMIANRWSLLHDWEEWAQQQGISCDQRTAVLVDIDKTLIGARGRNDRVIDGVRVSAVRQIAEQTLSGDFDEDGFFQEYDRLAKPDYYGLTADNQDYLAYIALMLMGRVFPAQDFWSQADSGSLSGFTQFVTLCDARRYRMSAELSAVHQEVVQNLRQGDPTPFKSFRYLEYFCTVDAMDRLPDDSPRADLLAGEIVITQEVGQILERLKNQGALIFGISDKPDEASTPPRHLAEKDAAPIHRVQMKVVGAATS